jgi:hypothetical protein
MSTSTFEFFPKLPLELQQEIWQLAATSPPSRIHLIAPDPRGTVYPRLLPMLDSNLKYRPKDFYPEIQLRLQHRAHVLPGLFSACHASRNAILPLYTLWESENGNNVYVNEKKDVLYFHSVRFWLLRIFLKIGGMSEDDQIARLQHMDQLKDCWNLAFDMDAVPPVKYHLWFRTLTGMKTMVAVVNAEKREVGDRSRFVVSEKEEVVREALVGSNWSFDRLDFIAKDFQNSGVGGAGYKIPDVKFVLISNSEAEEKWSKDLPVYAM